MATAKAGKIQKTTFREIEANIPGEIRIRLFIGAFPETFVQIRSQVVVDFFRIFACTYVRASMRTYVRTYVRRYVHTYARM